MEALKFINEQMEALGIQYEFGEWTSDVKYPYFVGEITEDEPTTEDGKEESTLILTGWNRATGRLPLEEVKNKIKKHFHSVFGLRAQTDSGAIAVFYGGAFYIPTNEADLEKIQINLKLKQWKGVL